MPSPGADRITVTDRFPTVTVVRSAERDRWRDGAVDSRQSFPATGAFDLAAGAFGALLIHNDDVVGPGEGFEVHDHRDVEIVTWVLAGRVRHTDRAGHTGVVGPGQVQRISAGRGISHTEHNAAGALERERLRVVQMWIAPDTAGGDPGYAQADFSGALSAGDPVTVVSGLARDAGSPALAIGNSQVALHIARPRPGRPITLPGARYGHLFVATGSAEVSVDHGDGPAEKPVALGAGDALRVGDAGQLTVTASSPGGAAAAPGDEADAPTEILYWEMHAGLAGR